jgi:hypothetical protein
VSHDDRLRIRPDHVLDCIEHQLTGKTSFCLTVQEKTISQ